MCPIDILYLCIRSTGHTLSPSRGVCCSCSAPRLSATSFVSAVATASAWATVVSSTPRDFSAVTSSRAWPAEQPQTNFNAPRRLPSDHSSERRLRQRKHDSRPTEAITTGRVCTQLLGDYRDVALDSSAFPVILPHGKRSAFLAHVSAPRGLQSSGGARVDELAGSTALDVATGLSRRNSLGGRQTAAGRRQPRAAFCHDRRSSRRHTGRTGGAACCGRKLNCHRNLYSRSADGCARRLTPHHSCEHNRQWRGI